MFPALEIELVADSAMHLAEQLQKGSLDIAFQTDLLRAESVRNVELVRYPIHWVVAANSGWRARMPAWPIWPRNASSRS
ncbi:LysR substrate-binding domain-containing protein [Ralstonia syzygii subsp. celebesensis]